MHTHARTNMHTCVHICTSWHTMHTTYVHIRTHAHEYTCTRTAHTSKRYTNHRHHLHTCTGGQTQTHIHTYMHMRTHAHDTHHTHRHTHTFAAPHSKSGLASLHIVPTLSRTCLKASSWLTSSRWAFLLLAEKSSIYCPASIRHGWAIFQALRLLDFFPMGFRMC